MLRTLLAVSCLLSGALGDHSKVVCYATNFQFPHTFLRSTVWGRVDFTPRLDGPRQVVFENGEVKNPRFSLSTLLSLKNVRNSDEGTYTFINIDDVQLDMLKLEVKDCARPMNLQYMDPLRYSPIDFEYVEFSSVSKPTKEKMLWSRNGTYASRRVRATRTIWEIPAVTPNDAGFYNFRLRDGSLSMRIQLVIRAHTLKYTVDLGDDLIISYPHTGLSKAFDSVTFTRMEKQTLMEGGRWVMYDEDDWPPDSIMGRLRPDYKSLTIESVEMTDEGLFKFFDSNRQRILTVELDVVETVDYGYYIVAAVIIFLLVLGCCCLRRCCCKKEASKGGSTAAPQDAAAPAVYYHDTTESSGPTYSAHSYSASPGAARRPNQPHNLVISSRDTPSHNPLDTTSPAHAYSGSPAAVPTYQPINPGISSGEPPSYNPTFTGPVPSFSIGSDCLSSDAEPRFELKGMTFPSAPHLGSDSTTSDVYNSDKLNFL